jgi:acyl-CoA synthetase (AMP-forming)/AMP-acid ligase II
MHELIERALEPPLFGMPPAKRAARLEAILRELTRHHIAGSREFRNIVDAMFPNWEHEEGLAALPFVPVGLFKRRALTSVPPTEIFKTLSSSGTTGTTPSRVFLDRTTATRQTRALAAIMQSFLGPQRRPMLIVDTDAILSDRANRTARAAGVLGMMNLGRHHRFLLDRQMQPQVDRLRTFVENYGDAPILIFGFTFMVWEHLHNAFAGAGIDLSTATLVHSGGWKQMEAQRVDNDEFKRRLQNAFGITHVVNFYGMAEQVGSVFIEGDDGLLHPAAFAEVIVRDPETWRALPPGEPGVLQVLSAVPTSYPGHSILTEDLGVLEAPDAFRVIGRVPKAELRGCSDTYASARRADAAEPGMAQRASHSHA